MVLRASSLAEFRDALATARANDVTTVVAIETDPLVSAPDSGSWWDVPVAEVAERESTREALARYEEARRVQRDFLRPTTLTKPPTKRK